MAAIAAMHRHRSSLHVAAVEQPTTIPSTCGKNRTCAMQHARRFRTPARIAKAPRRSDGRTLEFRCKHFSINNV